MFVNCILSKIHNNSLEDIFKYGIMELKYQVGMKLIKIVTTTRLIFDNIIPITYSKKMKNNSLAITLAL